MTNAARRWLLVSALALWATGCSTALSPYAQVEDEPEDEEPVADSGPARDAGARDAGVRDAGVRDAGVRDAGVRDAGTQDRHDCRRLPTAGFASLLVNNCGLRRRLSCSKQSDLDRVLETTARECGATVPSRFGVLLNAEGCPTQLRYDNASAIGRVSSCMQLVLEELRFGCAYECALATLPDLR